MHKQRAVLAQAASVRPGDKVKLPGRGPWPRVQKAELHVWGEMEIVTKRGTVKVPALQHIRVVRNA